MSRRINWLDLRALPFLCAVGLLIPNTSRSGADFGQQERGSDQLRRDGDIPPHLKASIQQQLDELKAGQEKLSRQLDEIKGLLQRRSGGAPAPASAPAAPSVSSVNVYGEPFRGTNSARVAIVEYSDFDCSFCGRYARGVFPLVDTNYVQTGKIRYYFRDLPEPSDTNSWFKALAARCAGDQGKFWQMHDLLFAHQASTPEDVVALSQTLGIELGELNQCLSSAKYQGNLQRSAAGAKKMGLYGTPAFLLGTVSEDGGFISVKRVLVGAESFASLKSVLDEMVGANPKGAVGQDSTPSK